MRAWILLLAFAQFIDRDEEENPLTVKVTPAGLAHAYRQSVDARGTLTFSKERVLMDAQLTIVDTTTTWPRGPLTAKRTTKRTYHATCE